MVGHVCCAQQQPPRVFFFVREVQIHSREWLKPGGEKRLNPPSPPPPRQVAVVVIQRAPDGLIPLGVAVSSGLSRFFTFVCCDGKVKSRRIRHNTGVTILRGSGKFRSPQEGD